MQKQQILGALVLLVVTAAIISGTALAPEEQAAGGEYAAYKTLIAASPAAELEGEALSPDGRFEVRTAGKSEHYVSGVAAPESLQIVDRKTGEVKWEDMGYLRQSSLWSPDSSRLALVYAGRTWSEVKIFETDTWTSWDFTLPDGGAIPEYTFLPEEWGEWLDPDTLLLTVGRGGDGEEQRSYRCSVFTSDGQLTGSTLEQTAEVLPGSYDFDHNGVPEVTELVTLWAWISDNGQKAPAWYELQIKKTDGSTLWMQAAEEAHVGWNSIFACQLDGQDYLLRYLPTVYQGFAAYRYEVFSLGAAGQEVLFREGSVEFDNNFGSAFHESFDVAAIAAFLKAVHGYLDSSTLLMTTEGGEFRTGGSGADFREDGFLWDEFCPYDETISLEENLRNYEIFSKEIQG